MKPRCDHPMLTASVIIAGRALSTCMECSAMVDQDHWLEKRLPRHEKKSRAREIADKLMPPGVGSVSATAADLEKVVRETIDAITAYLEEAGTSAPFCDSLRRAFLEPR